MAFVSYRQEDCTGPNGVSIDGRTWSDGLGLWSVLEGDLVYDANRIRNAAVIADQAIAIENTISPSLTDQRIDATVTNGNGLIVRYSASGYYVAFVITSAVYLYRVDAGVATFLDSGAWLGTGGKFTLIALGTTIAAYEGVTVRASAVDATYGSGVPGIVISKPAEYYDDIEVFVDSSFITTPGPTTPAPTTIPTTTGPPTSPPPTTPAPTTVAPTAGPTTPEPTTAPELTFPPDVTTVPPTTEPPPTTSPPTTLPPTTPAPTSYPGTTEPPTLDGDIVAASISYVPVMDQLVVRAWVKNDDWKVRDEDLDVGECVFELVDEQGSRFACRGLADELGAQYARFVIPQARLFTNHVYVAEVTLVVDGGPTIGPSPIMLPVK